MCWIRVSALLKSRGRESNRSSYVVGITHDDYSTTIRTAPSMGRGTSDVSMQYSAIIMSQNEDITWHAHE